MRSIKDDVQSEIVINKSKFITYLYRVQSRNEVDAFLSFLKEEYKGASHYCYAYIIDSEVRFYDDGEPSKTAGMPILNVLRSNNLNHVLAVVIRYFGGIKLGAGGLVRAYSNAVSKTLKLTSICEMKCGYDIIIKFNYEDIKYVDNVLKGYFVKKDFCERVIYEFCISCEKWEDILLLLDKKVTVIQKKSIFIFEY